MKLPADNKIQTLKEHYQHGLSSIYSKNEIDQLFYITIQFYLGLTKLDLLNKPDTTISESELLKLHFVLKELITYKPIQYILGECNFYGLNFKVNEAVLIPRPETEELVDLALKIVDSRDTVQVLDLCTGSGCIPITIKNRLKNSDVYGTDVSKPALDLARENAHLLNCKVTFIEQDLIQEGIQIPGVKHFDLITSNPPYILEKEAGTMHKNVIDFEPKIALFVPDMDPLLFYRKIAEKAKSYLKPDGAVLVEINEAYASETVVLFEQNGWKNIKIHQDLQGKDRIVQIS